MKKLLIVLFLIVSGLLSLYQFFPGSLLKVVLSAERHAAGFSEHTITVGDLDFSYLDGGKGEAVLLLHGFAANKDNWTRFAGDISAHYRLIAPDLIGFGQSSRAPDNDYRINQQVERVHAFAKALKLDKFHIGGSSMGGYIAGVYAATYPEQVASLLLISPSGVTTAKPGEIDQLLSEGKANPLVTETAEDYDHLLNFVFVEPPFIPHPIKQVLVDEALSYTTLHKEIFAQLHTDKNTPGLDALPDPITAPTLIIWGDQDRLLDSSGGYILQALIKGSELEIMSGVGHLPMIERPAETAGRYLKFLRQ